jgi:uncharacterized repeat protein (TIGR01451 family)
VSDDGVVTYEITATNPGPGTFDTDHPAVVADDLSDLMAHGTYLDDAQVDGPGAAGLVGGTTLMWVGPLGPEETVTITYSVRLDTDATTVRNVAWAPNDPTDPAVPDCLDAQENPVVAGTDAATAQACATAIVDNPVVEVTKTTDGTSASRPGDVITYTLRIENTGEGDFTTDRPAVVADDLADVLDDADWLGTETATAGAVTLTGTVLTWSGALGHGERVTVTYTVRLQQGGDGLVANVAWAPLDPETPVPPSCDDATGPHRDPASGEWCDRADFGRPVLTLAKRTDGTAASLPGDRVNFWIDLTNTGTAPFTAVLPAYVVDDLTGVLDGARLVRDSLSDGGAGGTFAIGADNTVSWRGPIPAGGTVTIHLVVILEDPASVLCRNIAWLPVDPGDLRVPECPAGGGTDPVTGEPCDTATFPRTARVQVTKSVDGTGPWRIGDTVTYTVTVRHAGGSPFTAAQPLTVFDDLTGTLDDATYNADASDGGAGGSFTFTDGRLRWRGPLAGGATIRLTYSVTLTGGGDLSVRNIAWVPADPDGGATPECPVGPMAAGALAATGETCAEVEFGVPRLAVTKTVEAAGAVRSGAVIRYQIAVTNTGTAAFTEAAPGEMTDSLAGLLGAADWNGDLLATHGTATWSAPEIRWRGALGAGQTAVVTYSLTLKTDATGTLVNTACAAASAGGACSEARLGLPTLVLAKRIVGDGPDRAGKTVTFEVTATNTGTGDFTETDPAELRDNLADVLDDATLIGQSVTAIVGGRPAGTVHPLDGDVLRWTGPLAAGQQVVLTYVVTYTGAGNHVLVNQACVPAATTPGEPCAYASAAGPAMGHTKKATLSTDVLKSGTVVTYTLHLVNTGDAAGVLDLADPLDDVLDDATWVSGPEVHPVQGSDQAVKDSKVAVKVAGTVMSISGHLAPHTTVDITYQVKATLGGNGDLLNYLAERTVEGKIPPAPSGPQCARGTMYRDNCVLLSGGEGEDPGSSGPVDTGLAAGTGRLVLATLALLFAGAVTMVMGRRRRRWGWVAA